ncbi:hypothetical protein [Leisingera sp. JC1]|uniref:hypothetical protein n=1 Tax=Leisingera sp. JC1 TaxID=1855282 RepID=UPI001C30A3E6|nr:hypothetical protein [Leisingera sp. JC1]
MSTVQKRKNSTLIALGLLINQHKSLKDGIASAPFWNSQSSHLCNQEALLRQTQNVPNNKRQGDHFQMLSSHLLRGLVALTTPAA